MAKGLRIDTIGYWSELKLDIIRQYAQSYSTILAKQPALSHVYVDAFSGSGMHFSRQSGKYVSGSPLIALELDPPFDEYHFIDLMGSKIQLLEGLVKSYLNAYCHVGDCNKLLLEVIFPYLRWEDRKRALCLLDPYGLHLDWEVVRTAGKLGTVEIFLNFPTLDMDRNVLWSDPSGVAAADIDRMNSFWGDDTWKGAAYEPSNQLSLFGTDETRKAPADAIVRVYQQRLKEEAGFVYVPDPLPMRNSRGRVIYYLLFASRNQVGRKIVEYIFGKYRTHGITP